jgi:general secretion pathway protein A
MYNKFYGFSENPFEVTPNPRFIYFTPNHRRVITSITDGIKNRRCFISITGEVGIGKTTLIRFILGKLEIEEKVKTVFIFHTTITFKELLKNILLELDQEVTNGSKGALLRQLSEYSIQMAARDETLVVFIDEAQDLPKEVLGELGMLPRLEAFQIVFVGQPEFEDKLNSQGLRQLKKRIGVTHQIAALTGEESKSYINHRLRLVGSTSSKVFAPRALSMICPHSRGIPRIINILCDNAFLTGYSLSQKKIDVDIIREVIKDMENPFPEKSFLSPIITAVKEFHLFPPRVNVLQSKTALVVLSILCLGGFVLLIDRYFQPKTAKTWDLKSLRNPYVNRQPSPMLPFPQESESDKLKEVVTVEGGQTLSSLAKKYYHAANTTLVALILDFNPEITNANLITVDQRIKIPKMTEELLIMLSTDHTYKIHLGTFQNPKFVMFYRDESALKGKAIEILPRKVSPRDTWYRVVVGPFGHKDECLKIIDHLRDKGLLPIFGEILKME